MMLIRSTFWLTLAFLIIGPRVEMKDTLYELPRDAMRSAEQLVVEQVNAGECPSLECIGTRMAISAGMQAVSEMGNSLVPAPRNSHSDKSENDHGNKNVIQEQGGKIPPIPRPRITRAG